MPPLAYRSDRRVIVPPFRISDSEFIDLGAIDGVMKKSDKNTFFVRDFILRKGDIDRTVSCPVEKKALYECTLTGEEEEEAEEPSKEKEEGADGGDDGGSDEDREYYGRRYADKFEENELERKKRPLFLAMREPEAGLPKNYAELKEVKTLRAPNKPREAFVAFKAKNYLKIIHELKASGEKKDVAESKAQYVEALSSFVNNTPARGWHKEVRPRLTSAVQDFFYYAPDGTKIRNKKEAETYCDDR